MHLRWFRIPVFLFSLAGIIFCQAATVTVYFTSAINGRHLQSNQMPLGNDSFVELGAFTVGFTPTAANRSSWLSNWNVMSRVRYDTTRGTFSGSVSYDTNVSPFLPSNRVWVWVYNRSGEWCVYSNAAWTWPNTSAFPAPMPLNCSTSNQGNTAIAGSVSTTAPRIICQQVTDANGPKISYTQWADLVFLDAGQRGRATDTDGDGQSNWYEYAFGSDPNNQSDVSTVVTISSYSGQRYLNAKIRRGWVTGVNYAVQWSENLTDWNATGLTTVVNGPTLWEVRDSNPVGFSGRRFLRVHITRND